MFEFNMSRMEAIYSRNGQNVLVLVAMRRGIMKQLFLQLMDLDDSRSYLDCPTNDIEAFSAFHTRRSIYSTFHPSAASISDVYPKSLDNQY